MKKVMYNQYFTLVENTISCEYYSPIFSTEWTPQGYFPETAAHALFENSQILS
jgi:hypothetical protein